LHHFQKEARRTLRIVERYDLNAHAKPLRQTCGHPGWITTLTERDEKINIAARPIVAPRSRTKQNSQGNRRLRPQDLAEPRQKTPGVP
jgi:hypothetical protein